MTHQHQTRWRRLRLAGVAGSLALAGLALAPAFAQPATATRVGRSAAAPATVTIWDIQTGDEQKNLNAFAASFNKAHPTFHTQYARVSDQDLLTVEAVPRTATHMETLAFYFAVVDGKHAELVLHWGTVAVPISIGANAKVVAEALPTRMRSAADACATPPTTAVPTRRANRPRRDVGRS